MQTTLTRGLRRILVIDDNEAIHGDFIKTLVGAPAAPSLKLTRAKAALFGDVAPAPAPEMPRFELESALQGEEGIGKAQAALRDGNPFNVAFVDMRMPPGLDGVATIQRLWEADPKLQIVICTAYSDYSWQEISQKLGTTDRLLILKKPFDPLEVSQLAAALSEKWALAGQAAVKTEELERMVELRTAELRHAALHDKLTGLPNRTLLREEIVSAIERKKNDPAFHFALLFLDFDRFKNVNDSYGHDVGDELLKGIAGRLGDSLRAGDSLSRDHGSTAARLGGDEFVVLATDLKSPQDAAAIARRLLATTGIPFELSQYTISSTASIGIATSAMGYTRAEDMLRDADIAMYHAKAAGRGCFVAFDVQMHAEAVSKMQIESDLRHAVERNELVLHYQPIVIAESGKLRSLEALVRWNHPTRGLMPPDDFIPASEETGLIVPIGYWVMEEGCRQLAAWHGANPQFADVSLNINFSARQLTAPGMVERFGKILRDTGVNPGSINLEITESVMIGGGESSIRTLAELKALGLRLYMDDFGTGYSSLSSLHRLPLDGLKIDRSLVNGIGERRDVAAVVGAVVTLAQNLGMSLTAEGIETADQLVMLQSMNCDLAQGYYLSRPLTADAAEKYFRQSNAPGAGRRMAS